MRDRGVEGSENRLRVKERVMAVEDNLGHFEYWVVSFEYRTLKGSRKDCSIP
jgi:hypothetical protein